jgi:hypothetical protein
MRSDLGRSSRATAGKRLAQLFPAALLMAVGACAPAAQQTTPATPAPAPAAGLDMSRTAPSPDPRVGLRPGMMDAGEAIWNMRVVSTTPPPRAFIGHTNSDLAFTGNYAIQGNYNGFQIWDISDPSRPELVNGYVCPASQSDVSVYQNLLFVSGEGLGGRLDCGTEGVRTAVSAERLRGIRIFDISDIRNPRYIANVQTCRGSHTHTVLEDPRDRENIYIYVSGSAPVRPAEELPGCVSAMPTEDPNSALFRIEVIRVPLANPQAAAIVSSPRIFEGLAAPPRHGLAPEERAALESAQARGEFVVEIEGSVARINERTTTALLDSIVRARGGSGRPTAQDSATLRGNLQAIINRMVTAQLGPEDQRPGPTQCHDITVYPAIGLAGGACEGYGLLLDITDPVNPRRIDAVADSNFAYWHSATFNNDGTTVLFSDEWGGGGQPKCRASDPMEWGANAIFTLDENRRMRFRSYYKMPAAQTAVENCVAHNGSLIPIPGRDIMVQSWYQGGVSIFEFTDAANPVEIAFHDRGPSDADRIGDGGTWSAYWYNGVIVSSEMARGLDIFELVPSGFISQNEIDAAKSVRLTHFNAQGQPRFEWPATYSLARAYVDQLEREGALPEARVAAIRAELRTAEDSANGNRGELLNRLASAIDGDAAASGDATRVRKLAEAVRALAR